MAKIGQLEQALVRNHLAFLSTHRGLVQQVGDLTYIESDRPEFAYALLGPSSRMEDLRPGTKVVQHFPWSGMSAAELQSQGFQPIVGFSYMVLEEGAIEQWRLRDDLDVVKVVRPDQMDAFSLVQGKGFNETSESFAQWHPWLSAANHRNLKNQDQIFYVGSLNGVPVGTVLSVFEGSFCGIYAVATLSEHRRKGISTTIINCAIHEAHDRGSSVVTLQVKQDSYVEEFYRHLGFERIFTTTLFRRD